jgi:(p)ppGpp synthase/HD superfamily hydrolase
VTIPTLEEAIAFAVQKYTGHAPDKGGTPYLLHPLRVMLAMDTDEERRVAVLHDVVEDCGVTPEELLGLGYPAREVEAVVALSRRDGESYQAFIERLRPDALARKVKLADLEHNMDVRRLEVVDEEARQRLDRYLQAWKRLRGGEAPKGQRPGMFLFGADTTAKEILMAIRGSVEPLDE